MTTELSFDTLDNGHFKFTFSDDGRSFVVDGFGFTGLESEVFDAPLFETIGSDFGMWIQLAYNIASNRALALATEAFDKLHADFGKLAEDLSITEEAFDILNETHTSLQSAFDKLVEERDARREACDRIRENNIRLTEENAALREELKSKDINVAIHAAVSTADIDWTALVERLVSEMRGRIVVGSIVRSRKGEYNKLRGEVVESLHTTARVRWDYDSRTEYAMKDEIEVIS